VRSAAAHWRFATCNPPRRAGRPHATGSGLESTYRNRAIAIVSSDKDVWFSACRVAADGLRSFLSRHEHDRFQCRILCTFWSSAAAPHPPDPIPGRPVAHPWLPYLYRCGYSDLTKSLRLEHPGMLKRCPLRLDWSPRRQHSEPWRHT